MVPGLMALVQVLAAPAADRITTVEAVCQDYPERITQLLGALDLERGGLEAVNAAVAAQDYPKACHALLDYYRAAETVPWLRKPAVQPGAGRVAAADAILEGRFTLYNVTAAVPKRPDGGLDWTYNGPDGDREWGWGLNRQYWGRVLLRAYQTTGNRTYVEGYDRLLRDWIIANPYPGEKNSTPQWRGLEVFSRIAGSWPAAFYALEDVPEFTPAMRILMLSSVPDHAHYGRHFHAAGGNWIAMELLGLATAAVAWPEFKEADAWFDYATTRIIPEMTRQVYPDGVQKELTSHYHRVALRSFDNFLRLAQRAGIELPGECNAAIEHMYNYLAYAMRPSGYGPLNNDSNLDFTRSEVLARVKVFNRPDWAYIATNGQEGEQPEGLPSVVFPWAGQVVMRSGWDAGAHWAFFDAGPLGIGHWHYDKLHLSVAAYGRDILVDAGRYTYKGGPWRSYFVGSPSHNVVLIDGKGQQAYEREAKQSIEGNYSLTPEFDYARGTYDAGFDGVEGTAVHTRVVTYVRGKYWVVVDRIDTDRPRTIQPLWHFHPDCTVTAEDTSVVSTDAGKGNVRIVPASDLPWQVDIVKGQTEPHIQGWYSRQYNIKQPSPCAVYTASIDAPTTFAWLILPARGPIGPARAGLESASEGNVKLRLQLGNAVPETITVSLAGNGVERGTH